MAILAGAQAGKEPLTYSVKGYNAPNRVGTPVSVTGAAIATASTLTLPVDPQGNAYSAYLLTAGVAVWIAWTNGSGNASIGGANCFLFPTGTSFCLVPPPGATSVSVIGDTGVTTGSFCLSGLY